MPRRHDPEDLTPPPVGPMVILAMLHAATAPGRLVALEDAQLARLETAAGAFLLAVQGARAVRERR